MEYKIVLFLDENVAPAVVHRSWICLNNKQTKYPNTRSIFMVQDLLKNRIRPSHLWRIHRVMVLKKKFRTFEEAERFIVGRAESELDESGWEESSTQEERRLKKPRINTCCVVPNSQKCTSKNKAVVDDYPILNEERDSPNISKTTSNEEIQMILKSNEEVLQSNRKVLQANEEIKRNLEALMLEMRRTQDMLKSSTIAAALSASPLLDSEEFQSLLNMLPAQSSGDVDEVIRLLEKKEIRNDFMNWFRNHGGNNVKTMTQRLLKDTISNEAAVEWSLSGKGKDISYCKKPFKDTSFI